MSPAGFDSTIPEIELPQTHAFDRAATAIDHLFGLIVLIHQIITVRPFFS